MSGGLVATGSLEGVVTELEGVVTELGPTVVFFSRIVKDIREVNEPSITVSSNTMNT